MYRVGQTAQKAGAVKNALSGIWQSTFGEVVESGILGPFNAYVEVVYVGSSEIPTLKVGYYELDEDRRQKLRMVGQFNGRGFRVTCPGLKRSDRNSEEQTLANLRRPGTEQGVYLDLLQCSAIEVTKGRGKQQHKQIRLIDFIPKTWR